MLLREMQVEHFIGLGFGADELEQSCLFLLLPGSQFLHLVE